MSGPPDMFQVRHRGARKLAQAVWRDLEESHRKLLSSLIVGGADGSVPLGDVPAALSMTLIRRRLLSENGQTIGLSPWGFFVLAEAHGFHSGGGE